MRMHYTCLQCLLRHNEDLQCRPNTQRERYLWVGQASTPSLPYSQCLLCSVARYIACAFGSETVQYSRGIKSGFRRAMATQIFLYHMDKNYD